MASIAQAYTNTTTTVIFVIVTDDMDWAETNLVFPDMKVNHSNTTYCSDDHSQTLTIKYLPEPKRPSLLIEYPMYGCRWRCWATDRC